MSKKHNLNQTALPFSADRMPFSANRMPMSAVPEFDGVKHELLREQALDRIERYRSEAVRAASEVALRLVKEQGHVTSTQVLSVLRNDPATLEMVSNIDQRFMGAVFRNGRGWKEIGWSQTGSRKRPVRIWTHESVLKVPE